jgi:hypothetical protein
MRKEVFFGTMMLAVACVPAWAASIVIGAPLDPGGNAFPFGGAHLGNPGTRYQQAYASTDFSGPMSIVGIDFFNGAGTLASGTYFLYLSTITAGIDTLSDSNFASNLGSDNTLFGTFVLSGAAPGTLSFAGGPFLYNPTSGNLLLDIIVSPGGAPGNGGYGARNGTASGIFSRYHDFGVGTTGYGLVTQFDFVPETSSLFLAGLGFALLAFRRLAR